ncbi:MAG: hypothetical protein WCT39_07010, partial [Candidatus Margulisiibacteriota bacterium]
KADKVAEASEAGLKLEEPSSGAQSISDDDIEAESRSPFIGSTEEIKQDVERMLETFTRSGGLPDDFKPEDAEKYIRLITDSNLSKHDKRVARDILNPFTEDEGEGK